MNILYTLAAQFDEIEAAMYYEEQRIGLGEEFSQAVDEAELAIIKNPKLGPLIDGRFRTRPLKKFTSYKMFYVIDEMNITVIAIWHMHQDPDRLAARLSSKA